MRIRSGGVAVLVVLGFALAGCGTDKGGTTGAPTPTTTRVTSVGPVETPSTSVAPETTAASVPTTLSFTATTVDGKPFDGASLAGKPVVLWFWAAWCPRCMAAAPQVAALQRDVGGSVTVLGVAGLNSGTSEMRDFVRQRGLGGFTHLADDDGVIWRKFGVTTQEYFVLIDAAGTVVHKGPLGGQALRDRVSALKG